MYELDLQTLKGAGSLNLLLFDSHPQPLWVYSSETLRFLAVNDAATACYGYTRDEFLGMTIADIRPAEDLDTLFAILGDLPLRGPRPLSPLRHSTKDGVTLWVEVTTHAIEADGQHARLAVIHDVSERIQVQFALQKEQDFRDAVLDTVGALVVVLDRERRIVRFNKACEALTGYDEAEVVGKDFTTLLLLPEEAEQVREVMRKLTAGHFPASNENYWVARDGTSHLISWTDTALLDDSGDVEFVIGTGINVTERRDVEAALKAAESNYRSIFENALEGIFQTTPDGQYQAANPALARIYGYDSPDDLRAHLTDIRNQLYVDPTDRERFAALMRESGYVSGFEAQIVRKDGSAIWIAEHARAVCDDQGELLYYEGTVQDISVRKALEAEREQLLVEAIARADRDPLTGLLNHRAFHKKLEEEADRALRTGEPLTVAVMDLDNFKFFNDAYGHAAGDDVLRQVADALSGVCRSYDTLARFGGDEFALLMPGTHATKAASLVQRLTGTLERIGYRPPGYNTIIPLELSVGTATFPNDAPARLDALALADNRLMRAKSGAGEDMMASDLRATLTDSLLGFSMLDALVTAVDNKDRYTRRHSEDVMTLCLQMAREMKLDPDSLHTLAVAALLHDVGKIGVPDRILRKPGHLSDEEYQAIQQHPMMGAIIVGAVAGLEHTLECIRHHHERWDGQGYPFNLRGDQIPRLARIMAVADAYSAITTDRPYRKGKSQQDALDILADGAGTQWDPTCVQALSRARRTLADACFMHQT